jgi:hypothetical protein
MPQDKESYSDAERANYKGLPCPVCGGPTITRWVLVDSLADPTGTHRWIPGSYSCRNPERHPHS